MKREKAKYDSTSHVETVELPATPPIKIIQELYRGRIKQAKHEDNLS